MTNLEIAYTLRNVAAAYQILGENRFKIIAYERAADSIEHLTSEVKDLWDEGKLSEIPGIGEAIAKHLDELFRTGHVSHFKSVLRQLPDSIFPLLLVPGIGPKKAFKLVSVLKLHNEKTVIKDLEYAAYKHKIAPIEGFGEKSEADILSAIATYKRGQIKENRMELPLADEVAQNVISYLRTIAKSETIDILGSLRRKVATIGDIDIAVATTKPEPIITHFLTYPHQKLIERGPTGASLLLHNGKQVDLRVQEPKAYGAMLQYFTGSKNHNIKLRSYALSKGLSLNEYGIKDVKSGKLRYFHTEKEFYEAIGLSWIPPELREDMGEVESAIKDNLPRLIEVRDILGDMHIHTSYDLESSHDIGSNNLEQHLDKAVELHYSYIGVSDHNPSTTKHTEKQIVDIMKKRYQWYTSHHVSWQNKNSNHVGLFVMCEVDIQPDGTLALPLSAFEYVDAVIVSIHSSFTQEKKAMTARVIKALTAHPKVRIFGHPTGRLLTKREGIELNWKEIFAVCKENDIALEINAAPARLDLPDTIVYDAVRANIPCCINTDAHAVDQMPFMKYGVAVARRGWATKHDIVNTMEYNECRKWIIK